MEGHFPPRADQFFVNDVINTAQAGRVQVVGEGYGYKP
jgi:hypothetical protein